MRYKVICGDEIIGESELETVDEGMNVRQGRFIPHAAYEKVENVFQIFAKATVTENNEMLATYYAARDELALEIIRDDETALPNKCRPY